MRKKTKSIMQSEVFVIIMIIIALLYITMSIFTTSLIKENKKKDSNITELIIENKKLKDINATTCIELKDLQNRNHTTEEQNLTICIQLKDLLDKNESIEEKDKMINEMNNSIHDLNRTLTEIKEEYIDLNETLVEIQEKYKDLNKTLPVVITLAEQEGFSFTPAKASLSDKFKKDFKKNKLQNIINNIKSGFNIIEVYGYTDTVPISSHTKKYNPKIDKELHQCLDNNLNCSIDIDNIKFSSNLELGLKRAISVTLFLKGLQGLEDITIKPYSGGQFINEFGKIAEITGKKNPASRRIEIKLSRSQKPDKFVE